MININIETIPHISMRYDTCGDWTGDTPGTINVRVSAMPDWRYEFLVGLHELIEAALCQHRGIKQADIDAFDMAHEDNPDPGMNAAAPYHREHWFATTIEQMMAAEMGVEWKAYDQAVEALK